MNTAALFDLFSRVQSGENGFWKMTDPKTGEFQRMLAIQAGRIVSAGSRLEGETLADVVVACGRMTAGQIETVLEKRARLDSYLDEKGIAFVMSRVAIKVVAGMLTGRATLAFEPGEVPKASQMEFDSDEVLLLGMLDASRGNVMLAMLGSPTQVVLGADYNLNSLPIPDDLKHVIPMLDGHKSMAEIIQWSARSKGRVAGLLLWLRERGFVQFAERQEMVAPPMEPVEMEPIAPVTPMVATDDIMMPWDVAPTPAPVIPTPVERIERVEPIEVSVEIVQESPRLKDLAEGMKMGLVSLPTSAQIAEKWGVDDDTFATQQVLIGEVLEVRYAPPAKQIEGMDPRFEWPQGFFQHQQKTLVWKLGSLIVVTALLGFGGLGYYVKKIMPPNPNRGTRIQVENIGPVAFDQAARAKALQEQSWRVGLAQGDAYVAKLTINKQTQWTIRLGIACQGEEIGKLLGVLGNWQKEDVFILPIKLDGTRDCYQVFVGGYASEDLARAAMEKWAKDAETAGVNMVPFEVLRIPRGA